MEQPIQTQERKGLARRLYDSFMRFNPTLKAGLIGYVGGLAVTVASLIWYGARTTQPEIKEYNRLENELNYSRVISEDNISNDRYMDSLITSIRNIKARKDSISSSVTFKKSKEENEKASELFDYFAWGGVGIAGVSIHALFRGRKKQKNQKK